MMLVRLQARFEFARRFFETSLQLFHASIALRMTQGGLPTVREKLSHISKPNGCSIAEFRCRKVRAYSGAAGWADAVVIAAHESALPGCHFPTLTAIFIVA